MLKQVIIINFQSMVRVQYDFIEGLNVIIAENGTGKSILNKIIYLMVNFDKHTKEEKEQYVRFGCTKSDIYFSSDKDSYWVEIYPSTINYHRFENGSYRYESNILPIRLKELLSLLVCNDGFIGNLITSKQSKLLVDSDDKVNTQTIGLITSDEHAELIIDTCESRLKEINSEIRTKTIVRNSLEKELSKVDVVDFSHTENSVNRVYKCTDTLESLIGCYESLEKIRPQKNINSKLEGVIDLLSTLEGTYYSLMGVIPRTEMKVKEKDMEILSELVNLDKKVDDLIYKKSFIKEVSGSRINEKLLGLMSRLEIMKSNLSNVSFRRNVKETNLDALDGLESLYESVDKLSSLVRNNNDLIEQNKKLKEELDSYGGEEYDCPIYGAIRFVNEECIHNYN